ncbi:Glutamate receptor ionotropic like protein [Argiope bruennichi]|uniref:Glutamate receptor 1 n=1 Tax=Argiope bruennichi TaxID=94029 RepID=A0A8T0FYW1_ARGBR|nr:Glutamate receptor ionotropic like protein [Argiope bruennichi]
MGPGFSRIFLLLSMLTAVSPRPDNIRIVGLFDSADTESERHMRHATDKLNNNKTILPRMRLSAHIVRIQPNDNFHIAKKVCGQIDVGTLAIVGPYVPSKLPVVQSTSTTLNVPHLSTAPATNKQRMRGDYSLYLYPPDSALSRAYRDIITSRGWKSFTIIYDDPRSLPRLQHLIMMGNEGDIKITLSVLERGLQYRNLLKDVSKKGETNVVLDVPASHLSEILTMAQSFGMMTEYHNYFITSLDLHTVDLQDFQHGRANISGFRLVQPSKTSGIFIPREWLLGDIYYGRLNKRLPPVKTQVALLYDSISLISRALQKMNESIRFGVRSCSKIQPWPQGRTVLNYLKTMTYEGMSGFIKFDSKGFRSSFTLDVLELKRNGLSKVGIWNSVNGLHFTWNYSVAYAEVIQSLKNRTLKVTTILNPPYMMIKKPEDQTKGSSELYEGFCVDLLKEMSRILGFRYELRLVRDGSYGSRNTRGEWNGMVRELMDREADLAIADFTITYEREQVVDFTMPFMNLGISILFRRPLRKIPKLFWFLRPLSLEVWMYVAAAYMSVSLLLYGVSRFSPYEWGPPHPCEGITVHACRNCFSIQNSLWFTVGSLMRQSSELTPRAASTRVVAATWWFFTLIMISSYTANLAAFLTVERMKSPIENADDLAKQTEISYGCVESGSTKAFFQISEIPVYKKMWKYMESARPSVFTKSNSEGKQRVLQGGYAFLMESTSIEYEVQRNCELVQIGGLLDTKGYGIATPQGSPYTTPFSSVILRLQEDGVLHELKERWWTPEGETCPPEEKKVGKITSELSFVNVGGIFLVLLAGTGSACVLVVIEFITKSRHRRKRRRR